MWYSDDQDFTRIPFFERIVSQQLPSLIKHKRNMLLCHWLSLTIYHFQDFQYTGRSIYSFYKTSRNQAWLQEPDKKMGTIMSQSWAFSFIANCFPHFSLSIPFPRTNASFQLLFRVHQWYYDKFIRSGLTGFIIFSPGRVLIYFAAWVTATTVYFHVSCHKKSSASSSHYWP